MKRRAVCGLDCKGCLYFGKELCHGCSAGCLALSCKRGVCYSGITSPQIFCRLKPYCPFRTKDRTPVRLPNIGKKTMAMIGFQKFVPRIDITDPRSWFWKHGIELPAIFVSLGEILLNKEILNEASRGLHDYLGFNGRIFLSLVMPDELIDKLTTQDYFRLIGDIRPDATMIPDNYTYTDDPLFLSWSQTFHLLSKANDFLKLDMPLMGLVKGANALQIEWTVRKQIEMGYVSFVMPTRELLREGRLSSSFPDNPVENALWSLKRASRDYRTNFELIIYGVSRKLKYQRLNYSNLSWFLDAKHGLYFKNGTPFMLNDSEIRFEECECEACSGMMPQEIIDRMLDDKEAGFRILVLHNLLDMRKTFEERIERK